MCVIDAAGPGVKEQLSSSSIQSEGFDVFLYFPRRKTCAAELSTPLLPARPGPARFSYRWQPTPSPLVRQIAIIDMSSPPFCQFLTTHWTKLHGYSRLSKLVLFYNENNHMAKITNQYKRWVPLVSVSSSRLRLEEEWASRAHLHSGSLADASSLVIRRGAPPTRVNIHKLVLVHTHTHILTHTTRVRESKNDTQPREDVWEGT